MNRIIFIIICVIHCYTFNTFAYTEDDFKEVKVINVQSQQVAMVEITRLTKDNIQLNILYNQLTLDLQNLYKDGAKKENRLIKGYYEKNRVDYKNKGITRTKVNGRIRCNDILIKRLAKEYNLEKYAINEKNRY